MDNDFANFDELVRSQHEEMDRQVWRYSTQNKKEMSFKNLQRQCFKSSFGNASYFVLHWAKMLSAAWGTPDAA